MIKGHTKIELFNAESGVKEKEYEEDNLVTNAVQYLIATQTMMGRGLNSNVFPIAKNALGGIMLFDEELVEDPDNVNFPSNAKLVGYADRDVNTSDSMRGSLNSLETHQTDTGYVSVWDFGTAQANGTIKSVALTSKYAGANPFQRQLSGDFTCDVDVIDSQEHNSRPFVVMDDFVYWIRPDGKTIKRCRMDMYGVKIADSTYSSVTMPYENVTELELPNYEGFNPENAYRYWIPGDDGYLYLITQNNRIYTYTSYGTTYYNYYFYEANQTGDAKIYINKYKYSDGTFKKQDEVIMTLTGVHLRSREEGSMVISNGYLYARAYDEHSIYIINLSNAADIKMYTMDNNGSVTALCPVLEGDGIQYQYNFSKDGTTYTKTGFLFSNRSHSEEATTGGAAALPALQCMNGKILTTCHYDGSYDYDRIRTYLRSAYLGTINNLGAAITKNASQTMKITYTLTDKEDTDETV